MSTSAPRIPANALHNLCRTRLPVFVMAGRSPYSMRGELPASRDNYVQFVQDPYDIASLARPYMKWEYTLSSGVVAKEVLRRAQSMMDSDPPGPVYLTLPREMLAEVSWTSARCDRFRSRATVLCAARGCDAVVAQAHCRAPVDGREPDRDHEPISGARPKRRGVLDALARECGIAVFESHSFHVNISRDSPCFAGFEPAHGMPQADVGLLLDVDVPWLPQFVKENPRTFWIQVDVDALKKDFPMWGFPADLRVQADCASVLAQVLEVVRARADPAFRARVAARMKRLASERETRDRAVAAAGASQGAWRDLTRLRLCVHRRRCIGADDIVINEAYSQCRVGAEPDPAHAAADAVRQRRQRARFQRRHGARRAARAAATGASCRSSAMAASISPTPMRCTGGAANIACRFSRSCSTTAAGGR